MPVKQSDFEFFVLQPGNGSTFHFSEYKTLDGVVHRLTETILPDGRTRYKRFHFNIDEPMLVHKANKELMDFFEITPTTPNLRGLTERHCLKGFSPRLSPNSALKISC